MGTLSDEKEVTKQMADVPHIILESQVGYPPNQPEKIQRSFDRNL
jgi:hypothetical protein